MFTLFWLSPFGDQCNKDTTHSALNDLDCYDRPKTLTIVTVTITIHYYYHI